MVQQYSYSRSPDHPYALEMLPLPKKDLDALLHDAKATYQSLFPAVKAAVRLGSDGEIFPLAHRHGSTCKSMAMWTTSALNGTLEEVAALYLDQGGRVPMLLDSARSRQLYELASPTIDNPLHSVSMRWSLWKPPSKLSNGRDICYLEYMDAFVDPETGHRVWARSMRSINHLCCPASQHPDGPIRTYMRVSGMIFRETDYPNVLEHVTYMHIDSKGASSWVVQQAISANKKAADSLNHVLKIMRQLNARQALGSSSLKASDNDKTRECKSCGERTSKWIIATRCRFCENILCKKCVDIRYHRVGASGKNQRMCLSCAVYTGSKLYTSHSLSQCDHKRLNQSKTHTSVTENREATLDAFSKSSYNQISATQSSVNSKCSTSMTDSFGSSSRQGRAAARKDDNISQLFSLINDSVTSSPASILQSGKNERHLNTRSFTLDAELEQSRAEPIDLSYLSELITPRAEFLKTN